MLHTKGAMRWAANFIALSALLHIVVVILGGGVVPFLVFAALYAACAYGLLLGWRWLGYIAFVGVFVGTSAAIGLIWTVSTTTGWLFGAIVIVNLLALVALFSALWSAPEPSIE